MKDKRRGELILKQIMRVREKKETLKGEHRNLTSSQMMRTAVWICYRKKGERIRK